MMKRFSAETYQRRRDHLMSKFESDEVLLFLGNQHSPINYKDNYYSFRQDSSFLYYIGLDLPDMAAVLDTSSGDVVLFGHDVTIDDVVWTGWQPSLSDLAGEVGIGAARPFKDLEGTVSQMLNQERAVLYLPPYRGETTLLLSDLMKSNPAVIVAGTSEDLVKKVIAQREIKEEQELGEIERALTISREAHLEILYQTQAGKKEADILGAVQRVIEKHQVKLAYSAILTKNGDILHNHYHGHILSEGDLLLCDVGAESSSYYASDITRTYPVSLAFTAQQRDIYSLVLQMLEHSCQALRPGLSYQEVHLGAARIMIEGLMDLGLMQGDVEQALNSGAGALFFPHGLGHMMGLDVHDMEDLGEEHVGYNASFARSDQFGLRSLRLGKPLQKGHVLTVEPGIYFIEKLVEKWESDDLHREFINYSEVKKFIGLGGIRLEDDYYITADGSRLLGPPIPLQIDEIEFLRGTTR